jgi:hypothetical protein
MPYLAFDLDALNAAPNVARAAGITEDAAIAGLARMWAWCFREEADRVRSGHVAGFFGTMDGDRIGFALSTFGFLESDGESWRVKGADRYLRLKEARREGGRRSISNLKRGAKRPGSVPATAGEQPEVTPGSVPALTPSTDHRAPILLPSEVVGATTPKPMRGVVASYTAPTKPPEDWSAMDFYAFAQERRQAGGLIPEHPPPRGLSGWYSSALMTPGVTVRALKRGFYAFGSDGWWEPKGYPFAGFMSQWSKFTRPEVRDGATA